MTKRRNFSDNFKATVALEALRGDKTVQEIAAKRQLHPTQVSTWKRQAIEGMIKGYEEPVVVQFHAPIRIEPASQYHDRRVKFTKWLELPGNILTG